jgi:hypothetical protein
MSRSATWVFCQTLMPHPTDAMAVLMPAAGAADQQSRRQVTFLLNFSDELGRQLSAR